MSFFKKKSSENPKKSSAKAENQSSEDQKDIFDTTDPVYKDFYGIGGLIRMGLLAEKEQHAKNRILLILLICLAASLAANAIQLAYRPEPKLLGETADGKIRPLPLLSEPIYNQSEIIAWAERCVSKIYNLSYVDWKAQIQNNATCLSDKSLVGFVSGIRDVGLLEYLNPRMQGVVYAVPRGAILRNKWLGDNGYYQWQLEVPYRLNIEGKRQGSMDLVMQMQVSRVSLNVRDDGLWVDKFIVKPANAARN